MRSRPIDPAPSGHFPQPGIETDTARVEVSAWLVRDDEHPQPSPATPAALRLGAEGLCVSGSARTWYVPYTDLESHHSGTDHVLLRMAGGRCLELRTPAPNVLQQHLEARLTAYARHAILAQRMAAAPSPTTSTGQLLSSFENPATASDLRLTIASWLGTRPLEPGDALYLRRILRDVADPELSLQLEAALELGEA
jgi:hypothetical protein